MVIGAKMEQILEQVFLINNLNYYNKYPIQRFIAIM